LAQLLLQALAEELLVEAGWWGLVGHGIKAPVLSQIGRRGREFVRCYADPDNIVSVIEDEVRIRALGEDISCQPCHRAHGLRKRAHFERVEPG
jgi:hypothetical protein